MLSLLPLALLPLLAHAGAPNAFPNGGNQFAGWSQGDTNIPKPTADWTGVPNGVPTHPPSGPYNPPKAPNPPAPAPAPASTPPAVSPAAGAPASPAVSTPPAIPAASPQSPAIPVPAAASSILSAISSAIGSSIIPGVTPAPAPIPAPAASGIGLPVPHGVPSPSDMIPAAQCSAGGSGQGQWMPFIVAHQNSDPALQCPTDNTANIHWFLDSDNIGCCPQNAYLSTAVAGQYACCPCGSSCAGLPPAAFQDWSLNGTFILPFKFKVKHQANLNLV
jgi:hypothetical protein